MLQQDAVEEVLVAVLEGGQPDVALEGLGLAHDVGIGALRLLGHRAHHGRQQALEPELTPLLVAEGGRLVVQMVAEKARAALPDLHAALAVRAMVDAILIHCRAILLARPRRYNRGLAGIS